MKAHLSYKQILASYINQSTDSKGVGLFQMGLMQFYQQENDTSVQDAVVLIEQAGTNHPQAYTFLGLAYLNGEIVQKDYDKALLYLEKGIEGGDYNAYVQMSNVYLHHEDIEPNIAKAITLLTEAANQNYSDAMLHLGAIYLGTPFLKPDYALAYDMLSRAHDLKNANATAFLGLMYENGYHVEKDVKKAWQLYLKGASCDSSVAHYFLAKMYLESENIKPNIYEAIHHFEVARLAGHEEAAHRLIDLYSSKAEKVYDMSKALSLLEELTSYDDGLAFYKLGKLYLLGDDVTLNIKLGLKYLRKSDTSESYKLLGFLYSHGTLTNNNPILALTYYFKGIANRDADCMYEAAKLILREDIDENAIALLNLASDIGNTDAMCLLARCYRFGIHTRRNQRKASELIQRCLLLGNPYAYLLLGLSFLKGIGEVQSTATAIKYLKEGAELGLSDCHFYLGVIYSQEPDFFDDALARLHLQLACNKHHAKAHFVLGKYTLDKGDPKGILLIKKAASLGNKTAKKFLKKRKK